MQNKHGPSTKSVHLTAKVDAGTRAITPPVVDSSAFAFPDLESWRQAAFHKTAGDCYSRNSNPTVRHFEQKMAAFEGAESATAFATGMAAISTTLFALLSPGQRAVTVRDAYGATYLYFTKILPRFGIDCRVCDSDDHAEIETALANGCRLLYLESPTNPTLKILDLQRLMRAAHAAGAIAIVDNTFATPINQNPISLSADVVIHSATKFLGGHGDVMGGVVCGRTELIAEISAFRELTGTSLDARSAALLLRSLKTLALRVERHNSNALAVAHFLAEHPKVSVVHYPGLETHPNHHIARRQMQGFGGVVSFELHGGLQAAERMLPQLQLAYLAPNLGQVETVAGPAEVTSHVELTDAERAASGIPAGLVRYAVGIEDAADLQADLQQALAAI